MEIETQEHLLKQLDLKEVDESLDKKDSHENDSRLFECKECGVKSEGRRRAWEHVRCHKLIKCTKCKKNIKTKSLLRHNRICGQNDDSDQNIHKCDQCTYSTHRSRNLRIHKKSRHTVKLEVKQEPMIAPKIYDTKMKEKMKCQNCSYESRDNWNLERHKVSCRNQEQHVLVFI